MSLVRLIFIFSIVFMPPLIFGDGLNKIKLPGPISTDFVGVKKRLSAEDSTLEDNPCNYKELEKPNFQKHGRRTSELKCFEYIWETEKREYDTRNDDICSEYKSRFTSNYLHIKHFVLGGRITKPGEFPHMGAIGWRAVKGGWMFLCGSSLISSKFILTAAHCSKVSKRNPDVTNTRPEIVRMGNKNIDGLFSPYFSSTPKQVSRLEHNFKILRIIVHPKYAAPKKYFDIAIIELEFDVHFNMYLQPACLWTHYDTKSLANKATVTGWGVIDAATSETSLELQAADVDILDWTICNHLLKPRIRTGLWNGTSKGQICAGKLSGGVDACQGDSGGPLQVKIPLPTDQQGSMHYLIGITSFGNGCGRLNTPALYTRVSSFIHWIENIVWPGTE